MPELSKKWYEKTWAVLLLLILFFPVGLYLMWKYTDWHKGIKIGISVFFGLYLLITMAKMPSTESALTEAEKKELQELRQEKNAQKDKQEVTDTKNSEDENSNNANSTNENTESKTETTSPTIKETVSQKNAVRSAKNYLNFSAFSHDGLVAQLEYEKFSHEDAVYGADNSGANWNEQAAKSANNYLKFSAFSREGLIEQLIYEKFTQEQAEYGVNAAGL